ncbi:TrmH family RNA methyltransferase [Thermoflexus sp.]|uniref:TrmH family RNA methyltransferase n=1 Tax=Thermoflexus sp. TaxID=1969742 RepID=UPI0035E4598E
MPLITSPSNEKVKRVRALLEQRKARRTYRQMVLESPRLIDEALRFSQHHPDYRLAFAFYANPTPRARETLDRLQAAGVPCYEVTPAILELCTEAETPQGIIAVAPIPELPWPEPSTFLILLDRVQEPGNVGAVLRSAAAAGAEGAIIPPGTADPWHPKAVRAAAGAHFVLPVRIASWAEIPSLLGSTTVWLATPGGEHVYFEVNWREPVTLILGGEASGPGPEAQRLPHRAVRIPMARGMESLNVAVAGALLLYEVARQRGWMK